MIEKGWEWIRGLARGFVQGVEFVRRLLVELGLWPADPTPVTPTAALVHPSLAASPPVWAVTSAVQGATFGRTAPPASAPVAPLPAPAAVAQTAPPEATPDGSPDGVIAPPGNEGHEAATVVEEPTPTPDLARAWLLATHPLKDTDASAVEVAWDDIPVDEMRGILSAAVFARARACDGVRLGCERDVLREWLGSVAKIAYDDPIERLRWMAAIAPSLVRDGISEDRRTELLGAVAGWVREIDRRNPEAVLGALRLMERMAASGIDPGGTLFEEAGAVWGERAWPRMRAGDAAELLQVSVTQMTSALARRDGPRARMFAFLVLALAPACYVDVADRLTWFAQAVAQPVGVAGLDGSPVCDVLTTGVGRWFEALSRGSTCDAVEVVLAWWQVPLGACTHEAPTARWISQVRPDPDDRVVHESARLAA